MLRDWYFCGCVDADPADAGPTIAALSVLTDPVADRDLLAFSIDELGRSDAWTRLYALPSVLTAAHRLNVGDAVATVLGPYLVTIAEHFPDECRDQLLELLGRRDIGADDDGPVMLEAAASCLGSLPPRVRTKIPYLDLLEFAPELAVLSVGHAALLAVRPSNAALAALYEVDSTFRALCESALASTFGRLPFLLAESMRKPLGLSHDPGRFATAGAFGFEPDLLDAYARTLLIPSFGPEATSETVASLLIEESQTLAHYSALAETLVPGEPHWLAIRRLGLRPSAGASWPEAHLIWTTILWELAVEVSAAAAARHLRSMWRPRASQALWSDVTTPSDSLPKDAAAIRCALSARLALVALRETDLDADVRHGLLVMVAHGWRTVARFQPWLDYYRKRGARPDVTRNRIVDGKVAGLLIAADELLRDGLFGPAATIPPQMWVDVLSSHGEQGDAVESAFIRNHLPGVLVEWIALAYQDCGIGIAYEQWIDAIPAAYAAHNMADALDEDRRLTANLLLQFFCPGIAVDNAPPDWRTARGPNGEEVRWDQTRSLLLRAPGATELDWSRWGEDSPSKRSTILIRAVERFAVFVALSPEDQLAYEAWRTEWIRELRAVTLGSDLDPFLRLRLLEFLTFPALRESPEEMTDLVFILLEGGSSHDLERLFFILFASPDSQDDAGRVWHQVKSNIVRAALRLIERAERDTSRRKRHSGLQTPFQRRITQQRTNGIKAWLHRIAYRAARREPGMNRLAKTILDTRERTFSSRRNPALAAETVAIDERQDATTFAGAAPPPWLTRAVIVDRGHGRATLFSEPEIEDGTLFCGFGKTPKIASEETKERAVNGKITVLAVLVGRFRKDALVRYTFACGLVSHISATHEDLKWLTIGTSVRLPLAQRGDGWWKVDDTPVPLRESTVSLLEIDEGTSPGRPYWLKARQTENQRPVELALDAWRSDPARSFFSRHGRELRKVWAVAESDGWRPLDCQFVDFLLRHGADDATVVSLIEPLDGAPGRGWRCATDLGVVFALHADTLTDGALDDIADEVGRLKTHAGLLVALRIVHEGHDLRLTLTPFGELVPQQTYPHFYGPFDDRNIRWTDRFDEEGSQCVAVRQGGRWVIEVDIPGFPKHVTLEWDGYPPKGGRTEATVQVTRWGGSDLFLPTARAKLLSNLEARPADGDVGAFFRRWRDIKEGDEIVLDAAKPRSRDGAILLCSTNEGPLVRVDAEGVSMRPLDPRKPPDVRGRRAIVTYVRPRVIETPLEIEPEKIPADAFIDGRCEGVFLSLPYDKSGTVTCAVAWRTKNGVVSRDARINNLGLPAFAPVGLGTALTGEETEDGWIFTVTARIPHVSPLWRHDRNAIAGVGALVLRVLDRQDTQLTLLCETAPGRLATAIVEQQPLRPMATLPGLRDGISRDQRIRVRVEGAVRAIAEVGGYSFSGFCSKVTPSGDCTLTNVDVRVNWLSSDTATLRRTLTFTAVLRGEDRRFQAKPHAQRAQTDYGKRWSEYLQSPRDKQDLAVVVQSHGGGWFVELPTGHDAVAAPTGNDSRPWTWTVPVAVGQGPILPHVSYRPDGLARLDVDPATSQVLATLRGCLPYTTENFADEISADLTGTPVKPKIPLYYCGRTSDLGLDAAGPRPEFVFEFGFGQILQVPPELLLFESEPFHENLNVLFSGDQILKVSFARKGGTDGPVVMAILAANLRFSEARSLYEQRKHLKMVHTLHVRSVGGNHEEGRPRVLIDRIDGAEDRQLNENVRVFERSKAVLSPASEERLAVRLASKPGSTILGRLDAGEFERSRGRSVVFDHVRFSFMASDDGLALRDNELIFVRAVEIEAGQNDCFLKVTCPGGFDPKDLGPDWKIGLRIARRQFSVREKLLWRILGEDRSGAKALLGQFLARVSHDVRPNQNGPGRVLVALNINPPLRTHQALAAALQHQSRLLAVLRIDDRNLDAEFRPGVFVRIPLERVQGDFGRLEHGAIIRVTAFGSPETTFHVQPGLPSERRYLPSGTIRPVLVLPKADLRRSEGIEDSRGVAYWQGSRFSLGDLPALSPTTRSYDANRGAWITPNPEALRKLMASQLKLGFAGSTDNTVWVAPADGAIWAGRLESLDTPSQLQVVSVTSAEAWLVVHARLSFSDASASAIATAASKIRWRYHDRMTITWNLADKTVSTPEIGDRSAKTGPLFFLLDGQVPVLRYPRSELSRFGLPFDALCDWLSIRRTGTVVAAAQGDDGLWVELGPGRVAELPASVVRHATNSSFVTDFFWPAISPGDRLQLTLVEGDAQDIDTVSLSQWQPGIRGALGKSRALLPVKSFDNVKGALVVGAGMYMMTLPYFGEQPTAVMLDTQTNDITAVGTPPLKPGDVVFVGLTDNFPTIVGTTIGALPWEQPDPWQRAGLSSLISPGGGRLRELLAVVGGALPLTVESVGPRQVYVSPRNMATVTSLVPGKRVGAAVLGLIGDGLALMCGGSATIVPFERVVAGTPPEARSQVVKSLSAAGHLPLSLTRTSASELSCLSDSGHADLVRTIGIAVVDCATGLGLVCRDVTGDGFYWMDGRQVGWTTLDRAELELAYVGNNLPPARRLAKGDLSIVQSPQAIGQFAALSVGDQLSVEVVTPEKRVQDKTRCLVRTFGTRILLEFEREVAPDTPMLQPSKVLPVQIERRSADRPSRLTVVPVGEGRVMLDLPNLASASKAQPDPALLTAYVANHDSLDVSTYRAHLRTAEDWVKLLATSAEFSARNALMALLVLRRYAQTPVADFQRRFNLPPERAKQHHRRILDATNRLTLMIGRAALRSFHSEILGRLWYGNADFRSFDGGLWPRLRDIATSLQNGAMSEQELQAVIEFFQAVELRADKDLSPIAHSLMAAVGALREPRLLIDSADILKGVVTLFRSLPRSRGGQPLLDELHVRLLGRLIDRLDAQGDVALMRGIDWPSSATSAE